MSRRAWALAGCLLLGSLVGGAAPALAAPGPVQVGAARTSIEPRPDDFGGTWQTEGCAVAGDDITSVGDHVADFRSTWPENPDCIYMGGFGIGPANPVTAWDQELGLWVRSIALGNGEQTVVLTILDGAYYLGDYASLCDGCGAFELADRLGAELGIDPASFVLAASHSHASPDFIGAWGGVPDWYMQQVEEAILQTVREAVGSMQGATVEYGEELARPFNAERRATYRSAETETLTWLRAVADDGSTIATLGAYGAHPTTVGTNDGVAHPDWVGLFERRLEDRFGGVGLHFMTGLGNHSARGGTEMGVALADLVPEVGSASAFDTADARVVQQRWDQPVTNAGLLALGLPQFFDRPIQTTPGTSTVGKSDEAPCVSGSPLTIRTGASALAFGPLTFTAGPGELFSNLTNSLKEGAPDRVVVPMSIANDGLGYIVQEFEADPAARQVVGFAGLPFFEYEEAYNLDRCFGDEVLERTLAMMTEVEDGLVATALLPPGSVGADDEQPGPSDPAQPSPAPGPTKSPLPATGGGIVAVAVATIVTAATLRRRRDQRAGGSTGSAE